MVAGMACQPGYQKHVFQPPARSLQSLRPIYQEQSPPGLAKQLDATDLNEDQSLRPRHKKPQPRYYTITIRDTLWSIAIRHLGDGARYKEILQLNPDLDPNKLPIGGKIILPNELPQESPPK